MNLIKILFIYFLIITIYTYLHSDRQHARYPFFEYNKIIIFTKKKLNEKNYDFLFDWNFNPIFDNLSLESHRISDENHTVS